MGTPRYYRHSFQILQRAVAKWKCVKNLKFSINFGDIIDGHCPKDQSLKTVQKVLGEFEKFDAPAYHMIGNHCLSNLPHGKLMSLLNIPSHHGCAYYDFYPVPEYRFVVFDGYDISAIGWTKDHPKTLAAMELLQAKNPNTNKNSPNGLVGLERRFLMFNGTVGPGQNNWSGFIESSKTPPRISRRLLYVPTLL